MQYFDKARMEVNNPKADPTGNGFVTEDAGYAQGFREYRNMMREQGIINGVIFGEKIVDAEYTEVKDRK